MMTEVFLVFYHQWSDSEIIGVASTGEQAVAMADSWAVKNRADRADVRIHKMTLDTEYKR